jgi:hypothetical protein
MKTYSVFNVSLCRLGIWLASKTEKYAVTLYLVKNSTTSVNLSFVVCVTCDFLYTEISPAVGKNYLASFELLHFLGVELVRTEVSGGK